MRKGFSPTLSLPSAGVYLQENAFGASFIGVRKTAQEVESRDTQQQHSSSIAAARLPLLHGPVRPPAPLTGAGGPLFKLVTVYPRMDGACMVRGGVRTDVAPSNTLVT